MSWTQDMTLWKCMLAFLHPDICLHVYMGSLWHAVDAMVGMSDHTSPLCISPSLDRCRARDRYAQGHCPNVCLGFREVRSVATSHASPRVARDLG